MKPRKTSTKLHAPSKKIVIRTTFLDLIGRLAEIAKDDAALIVSVRRVLEGCNVRLLPSMAPMRVAAEPKRAARKIRPAWA